MSNKAKNCGECVHFTGLSEYHLTTQHCRKLHKPRFYDDPNPDKWGWRRKCDDFKTKEETK